MRTNNGVIEFIREHPASSDGSLFMYLGLSGAQYISLIMVGLGIWFHYYLRKKIEHKLWWNMLIAYYVTQKTIL